MILLPVCYSRQLNHDFQEILLETNKYNYHIFQASVTPVMQENSDIYIYFDFSIEHERNFMKIYNKLVGDSPRVGAIAKQAILT